ncbi:hypothetical protein BT67DRAFT_441582, partial [Trichocladium antarcticum]
MRGAILTKCNGTICLVGTNPTSSSQTVALTASPCSGRPPECQALNGKVAGLWWRLNQYWDAKNTQFGEFGCLKAD